MDINNIVKSLNDFNKIVRSPFQKGYFGIVSKDEEVRIIDQENFVLKNFITKFFWYNPETNKTQIIETFKYITPFDNLDYEQIAQEIEEDLVRYLFGFILYNFEK